MRECIASAASLSCNGQTSLQIDERDGAGGAERHPDWSFDQSQNGQNGSTLPPAHENGSSFIRISLKDC